MKLKDFKLCYVENENRAFFTTQDVRLQWGDDWNDSYQHNASQPYTYNPKRGDKIPYEIMDIYFDSNAVAPESFLYPECVSVKDINSGTIPWLIIGKYSIFAGTPIKDFIHIIELSGGTVYLTKKLHALL